MRHVPSLMVVEGGQIEHFDKVTEEDQPGMLRFYDCTIFISYTLTCTEAAHDNAHEVVDCESVSVHHKECNFPELKTLWSGAAKLCWKQ